ncbi:MAG: hypothetical protein QOI80_2545 [Solirubrobacteraceae bacterium]|nr:hypothetical protein [Solirubrobacteraceae bacterium]
MSEPDHRAEYLAKAAKSGRRGAAGAPQDDDPDTLLARLADPGEDRAVRLDALTRLQAMTFAVERFRPTLPRYIETLREIATGRDRQVRRQALEVLALRRDEYAQRLLIEGLEGERPALVPQRMAVKLLGYDQHATPSDLLGRLATESSDTTVRRQALRALSADGSRAAVFRRIAADPDEDPEIRRIGLTALQSLDPQAFGDIAARVAVDDDVDEDLRAVSLTALAGEARAARASGIHDHLEAPVRDVRARTSSRRLTRAADDFLDAVRRD